MTISKTFRDFFSKENFLQEMTTETQEFGAFYEDWAPEFSEVLEDS